MNKKIIIVSVIATLLFISGITYALYEWQSNQNTLINVYVENTPVNYQHIASINNELIPTLTKEEGIVHTFQMNTNSEGYFTKIILNVITLPNILKDENFKWELYRNNNLINNGNFSLMNEGDELVIANNQVINQNMSEFKLYIWIDGNADNNYEMFVQKHTFNLVLKADAQKNEFPRVSTSSPRSILASNVNVGDYIDYNAGNWNTTIALSDLDTNGEFGGYTSGESRNNSVNCNSTTFTAKNGWRVLEKNDDIVTLIHAGTPECMYKDGTDASNAINIMNTRDYSYYVNSYATSASIAQKSQLETIVGGTIENDSGFYDDSNDIYHAGSYYYVPYVGSDATRLLYVQTGGYIGSNRYKALGIRPTITLKKEIYINGGSGTSIDPYQLSFEPSEAVVTEPETKINKNGILIGFYQNWSGPEALKLADVPINYDYVNLSFAVTPEGSANGIVDFSLDTLLSNSLNYSEETFKNDIQVLKLRGQKVLLSIGGAGTTVIVNDSTSINNFVTSVNSLIQEYDLDGIDIDIESPLYASSLATAIRNVHNANPGIIITYTPETAYYKVNNAATYTGAYYELTNATKDIVDLVSMQIYNSGDQYGLDGNIYYPGTIDFITSQSAILLESGLQEKQVGVGIISYNNNTATSGYVEPATVIEAFNSLKTGIKETNSNYQPLKAYTNLQTFMIWSINIDYFQNNNAFYDAIIDYLD